MLVFLRCDVLRLLKLLLLLLNFLTWILRSIIYSYHLLSTLVVIVAPSYIVFNMIFLKDYNYILK